MPARIPTPQDIANAELRQQIAARLNAEYEECLGWAVKAFGPGWHPSCRHSLVDKDEKERVRYSSERPREAATVYTVKNREGEKRFFILSSSGEPVPCASIEEGFGPMLLEPHPTRGFMHQGKWCPAHRYSLNWAGYELYRPMSAEHLAALREAREREGGTERPEVGDGPPLACLGGDHAGGLGAGGGVVGGSSSGGR